MRLVGYMDFKESGRDRMNEPVISKQWRPSPYFAEEYPDITRYVSSLEAKVAEQAATIAKEESRSNELAKEVAILRVDLRGLAATLERLTGYLDYMAMGFVPPDRCKSYAAAALKNPSEPK